MEYIHRSTTYRLLPRTRAKHSKLIQASGTGAAGRGGGGAARPVKRQMMDEVSFADFAT